MRAAAAGQARHAHHGLDHRHLCQVTNLGRSRLMYLTRSTYRHPMEATITHSTRPSKITVIPVRVKGSLNHVQRSTSNGGANSSDNADRWIRQMR